MKDIVIKEGRIKKEIIAFAVCFVFALALNIYSILKYNTKWSELVTCVHIVLALAVFFYAVSVMLRLLIFSAGYIIKHYLVT